jgi:hypothetical protein
MMTRADRNADRRAQQRHTEITAQIAAIGLPLPGSLVERRTRCGNPTCRCRAEPPQLHGPYLTWTRKVDGKTVTRTLTAEQAATYRQFIDNARRLRQLVAELENLALHHVEQTRP